jgi:hypothetical protein
MINNSKTNNFVQYYTKELDINDIDKLNRDHDICFNKLELYYEFIVTLTHIIDNTYLGDNFLKTNNDIIGHFKWCWLKNIDTLKKQNIFFDVNGEHYNYFLDYFVKIYYEEIEKDNLPEQIIIFWYSVFNLHKKTRLEYDIFIEIYKIFDNYFINHLIK